jgi:serine protease Do
VGDQVAAFGSPFNLPETFSLGIVSALGRSRVDVIPGEFRVQNFIQTDAAINPGNSGGPLVNMRGEVIGINSAIATKSGSYNRIGFAIPTSIAKPVMEALIAHKKVVRGYLGVQIADLNDLIAEKEGYKNVKEMSEKLGLGGKTGGALVKMVMAKTPAFKAGVQPEDVIVEYQGQPVKDVEDLRNRVSLTPVGANAAMKVVRDGKPIVLTVPIAEQPEEGTLASVEAEPPGETGAPSFGITPQRLTPDLAKKHGYEADEGVLIGEVGQGSPADLAGLREGVLVREVDGKPVKTIKEFNEAMAAAQKSKKVKLLVRSEEGLAVVVLRVGAEE